MGSARTINVTELSALMSDISIIPDGLLLELASSSDSFAALRSDLVNASATSADSSTSGSINARAAGTDSTASDGLAANDLPFLADGVMKLSVSQSEGGGLLCYQWK
jgi:hypothetical protein